MQQLIEYCGNHPYLVAAAALMVMIVIVSELRARIQEFAAVAPTDAIRMMNQGALVIDVRDSARSTAATSSMRATCCQASWPAVLKQP